MSLVRVGANGFFQNADSSPKIRLRLHLAVGLRNALGDGLPLLLFDIEFQRLEERITGVLLDLCNADRERRLKVVPLQMLLRLGVRLLYGLALRPNLVIQGLVIRGLARRCGLRCQPVQFQHALQLAERGADFAPSLGLQCGAIILILFLLQPDVVALQPIHLRQQLRGPHFLRPELQHALQRTACMRVLLGLDVLLRKPEPIVKIALDAPVFDSALEAQCLRILRVELQYLFDLR